MTVTSFDEVIERSLRKLEMDADFFSYYNISQSEAESLIREQTIGYIKDAIDLFSDKCELKVDLYDYDETLGVFNNDLTKKEIGILASLVYQVYFERQLSLLGAFKLRMSPSDLNVFSPANERKTFMSMLHDIRHENDIAISKYAATDRLTGKHLSINHDNYDYS